jgi:hypothetical protein
LSRPWRRNGTPFLRRRYRPLFGDLAGLKRY